MSETESACVKKDQGYQSGAIPVDEIQGDSLRADVGVSASTCSDEGATL